MTDWFRGEMSSRWLWVRLQHLPETSAFKTAVREGDWDTDRYLLMHIANELKASRADFAAANGTKTKPQWLVSPRQQQEKADETQLRRDVRGMILGQLRGEYVPPTRDVAFLTEDTRGSAGGDVHG